MRKWERILLFVAHLLELQGDMHQNRGAAGTVEPDFLASALSTVRGAQPYSPSRSAVMWTVL